MQWHCASLFVWTVKEGGRGVLQSDPFWFHVNISASYNLTNSIFCQSPAPNPQPNWTVYGANPHNSQELVIEQIQNQLKQFYPNSYLTSTRRSCVNNIFAHVLQYFHSPFIRFLFAPNHER